MPASTSPNSFIDARENVALLSALQSVVKTDGALLNGAQSLFTISGGPCYGRLVGIITGNTGITATNGKLQITTVSPAATTDLSTAVACASKTAGTSIRFIGATGALTLASAGAVIVDPVSTDDSWFLLPVGTVKFLSTASDTGSISWFLQYVPLCSDTLVTAA